MRWGRWVVKMRLNISAEIESCTASFIGYFMCANRSGTIRPKLEFLKRKEKKIILALATNYVNNLR